jgi:outer membrane protein assembly factor BamB
MSCHIRYTFRVLAVKLAATVSLMLAHRALAADVLTWHNDLARTGLNAHEWALRPDNVNFNDFGKLFVANLDGQVYAQPLIVTGLQVPSWGVYNVLYTVTEHNSVYSIDADTGFLLWHVSLLAPGETPADTDECDPITPEVGITSTPVIDRTIGPHGTIYVETVTRDAGGHYHQRLHALDLTAGTEQFGGPVEIIASYPGTGDNSLNGNVIFDPQQYYERAGLALSNGVIYTTWASRHDCRPYTSWIIGYDAHTLQQVRVINLTPNGYQGAIWQSAAAPAIDPNGFLYVMLGNGKFDTALGANGFPSQGNFGNCFVKLSPANNSLSVADYWTMFNNPQESMVDYDLGSSGPVVLPDMTDGNGIRRRLAVAAGKDAHIYIADRNNMGKYNPNGNITLYQELPGSLGSFNFSTPAFFNGWLYFGAVGDVLRAFSFTNARMNGTAVSRSTNTFGFPGSTPSISANGTAFGILWAAENEDPAVLHAFDARDLSRELYNTNQAPNSRDHFGPNTKFGVPTIANGKVYVATTGGTVGAFGLFNSPRLANSIWRSYSGLGNNVLTGKFVVQGSGSKNIVFRALGPSLQVNARLQDPVLELYNENGNLITYNNNWATDVNAGQLQAYELAPSDGREAALARTLPTGSYTLVVRGAGSTTGIGQLEMYDLSQQPTAKVANMSARGLVAGGNVLIGTLTVTGRASQTVLFRAIGRDLIFQGVPFALRNPTLELYDSHGTLIASNDDWKNNQQAQIEATGLAPGDDRDAAILLNLQPGTYFPVVRGAGGTIGIALVEAYAVQL